MPRLNISDPDFEYDPEDPEGFRAGMLRLVEQASTEDEVVEGYRTIALDRRLPPTDALRSESAILLRSLDAVRAADADPGVRVVIIRGAGQDFCSGYDLDPGSDSLKYGGIGSGVGRFQRAVVDGWLSLADLAVPVIAQVHGHCLAGGSELAASCDLVYVASDALIGYPAVRFERGEPKRLRDGSLSTQEVRHHWAPCDTCHQGTYIAEDDLKAHWRCPECGRDGHYKVTKAETPVCTGRTLNRRKIDHPPVEMTTTDPNPGKPCRMTPRCGGKHRKATR